MGYFGETDLLKKSKQKNIILLGDSGEITDPSAVANKFANYFNEIGRNLDNNLNVSNESPSQHVSRNPHSFYFFQSQWMNALKLYQN